MKNIYLSLLLICISASGFSQTDFSGKFKHKATYSLTYQPDSTNVQSSRTETMVLYLGDRVSRFSSLGKAVGDSLMQNRDKSNKSMADLARMQSQTPETKFEYLIYKGMPEGKVSYIRKVMKDNFRYEEEPNQFQWEILPEMGEIAGFQVQKAVTSFAGREYTAWFTPEIPISDGPYKFGGLPGLILEVQDQKGHYHFQLTDFRILEDPVEFQFDSKDYLLTKKEKLIEVVEAYNQDPFASLERNGITFGFKPGQKEKMMKEHREELKKENNPIELE